jgi:hypothetical protein
MASSAHVPWVFGKEGPVAIGHSLKDGLLLDVVVPSVASHPPRRRASAHATKLILEARQCSHTAFQIVRFESLDVRISKI